MSTPIIVGGGPPPVGTRIKQSLKKWGVLIGGAAAATGATIIASPEFGDIVVGAVSKKLDPTSVGYAIAMMGVQQAIVAARRKLLGLAEPN